MSVAFVPERMRGKAEVNQETIQRVRPAHAPAAVAELWPGSFPLQRRAHQLEAGALELGSGRWRAAPCPAFPTRPYNHNQYSFASGSVGTPVAFGDRARAPRQPLLSACCVAHLAERPKLRKQEPLPARSLLSCRGGSPKSQCGAGRLKLRAVGGELLEENDQLIRCIVEYQNKGRAAECTQYQHVLHRNLIYLATIADASPANAPKTED
ncbi:SS18-like protein 2 isoform X1 [Trichosurus vulpecula]|uniref:SS18-like protein 2 isoform X1 n=1 Tax=Trichosurus vulpecula TaxID=9337 RepID=UPI00186B0890|nr:SS18-like protein 2 isoform X1 [Trichosurus vulpecula]